MINEFKRKSENTSSNAMLLAGIKKDSAKLESAIIEIQKKIKKLIAYKENEERKNAQALEYYRIQV